MRLWGDAPWGSGRDDRCRPRRPGGTDPRRRGRGHLRPVAGRRRGSASGDGCGGCDSDCTSRAAEAAAGAAAAAVAAAAAAAASGDGDGDGGSGGKSEGAL